MVHIQGRLATALTAAMNAKTVEDLRETIVQLITDLQLELAELRNRPAEKTK